MERSLSWSIPLSTTPPTYVRKEVHARIEALKRLDATAHMQKHDVYTEPDKRPDAQVAEEYAPEPTDEDGETARRQEALLGRAGWQQKDDISDAAARRDRRPAGARAGAVGDETRRSSNVVDEDGGAEDALRQPSAAQRRAVNCMGEGPGLQVRSQKPEDMHVTICYSKEPFDWDDLEPRDGQRHGSSTAAARLHQFGDAVVLEFDSPLFAEEHGAFVQAGASYDFRQLPLARYRLPGTARRKPT